MKSTTITRQVLLTFLLTAACLLRLSAQSVPTGPSDPVKAPPTNAGTVKEVLCATADIKLRISATTDAAYKTYKWYKITSTATELVKEGTENTYTETPAGAGYYSYRLVVTNNNDCTSQESDIFEVYVLPALGPAIAATRPDICEKELTSSTLSVTGLDSRFDYNYQWTRNGSIISGATNPTYEVKEATAGNVAYGLNVSYKLNTGCTVSVSQQITVIAVPAKPVIEIGG